jgi:hypothetical protein
MLLGGSVGAVMSGSLDARAASATAQEFSSMPHLARQAGDGLPRSTPEEQGVDSRAILSFLDEVVAAGHELHSFMLYRHGHVVAEAWWWPYRADRNHMQHSLTKSVTASGVGLAIAEGHFGLDDHVISFFKGDLSAKVDDKLAAMRVRDLLTMQTGHDHEVSGAVWRQLSTSWVAEFFKIPVVYQPGTKFVYTSAATYMLSAIITRTTGQTLRDYLEPRFFRPLGIHGQEWDVGPGGINPGGNGLSWKTADSLKLGALYVQKGLWQGKRILPADWVQAATTPKVATGEYGYQWWMGPNKAFYADGKFTQLSIGFPDHDAVLAFTAGMQHTHLLLEKTWRHFPAAFGSTATPQPGPDAGSRGQATLAARDSAAVALRDRCEHFRLLPPLEPTTSPTAARISGRTFAVERNEDQVTTVRFDFAADQCVFKLRDSRGEHTIVAGLLDWIEGDTSMTGNQLHHQYQPDHMRVVAGGRWLDDSTFEMTWQFVETAFRDRVVCRFNGDAMTLDRSVNVNSGDLSRPTLHGKLS